MRLPILGTKGCYMIRLSPKKPYDVTLANPAPPYVDYDYFAHADQLPFRFMTHEFDLVNAGWLIGAATLVYADEDSANEKFNRTRAGFKCQSR